jgi:hypothetical protein
MLVFIINTNRVFPVGRDYLHSTYTNCICVNYMFHAAWRGRGGGVGGAVEAKKGLKDRLTE